LGLSQLALYLVRLKIDVVGFLVYYAVETMSSKVSALKLFAAV
jgi:hypothetical protein